MPTINKPKRKVLREKNTKNQEIAKIYNTPLWKNLRKAYYMQHPLCEKCLEKGIISKTEEIHHIREISNGSDELEMKDIAYDPNNLMALCKKCHHEIHNK